MKRNIKILLAISCCLISILLITSYFYFKKKGDLIAAKAARYVYQKTGRNIEIAFVSYSLIDGLILKNLLVKEKDGKTIFFRCEKAQIKLDEKKLMDGTVLFEKAKFYNGHFRISKQGQEWNFKDLIDIIPPSKKPIHLLWNARSVSFENFDFYVTFDLSKNEFSASKVNFSIDHRSSLGGNFFAQMSGLIGGIFDSKPISFELKSQADIVFDYAKTKSVKADIELKDISYDQISAPLAKLTGVFFHIENPLRKNFKIDFSLRNLFVYRLDKSAVKLFSIIEKLEKAIGRNISSSKEISVERLDLHANSKNGLAEFIVSCSSNILSFKLNSKSRLNPKKDSIKIIADAGDLNLSIDAESDFSKVFFKQALSETSSEAFREIILKFENDFLIKNFL